MLSTLCSYSDSDSDSGEFTFDEMAGELHAVGSRTGDRSTGSSEHVITLCFLKFLKPVKAHPNRTTKGKGKEVGKVVKGKFQLFQLSFIIDVIFWQTMTAILLLLM